MPSKEQKEKNNSVQEQSQVEKRKPARRMPLIVMRGNVFFPGTHMGFEVQRKASVAAAKAAMRSKNQLVYLCTQKDEQKEEIVPTELYEVGVVVRLAQIVEEGDGILKIMAEGLYRGRTRAIKKERSYYLVTVEREDNLPVPQKDRLELEALRRQTLELFEEYAVLSSLVSPETVALAKNTKDLNELADMVILSLLLKVEERQKQLELLNIKERMQDLVQLLARETKLAGLSRNIAMKVHETMDKNQREYFLREQIHQLQAELGEDENSDVAELSKKLREKKLPEEARKKLEKEIERFSRMPENYPESTVQRNWIECVLDLPWGEMDEEDLALDRARKILDRDHYGLKKVKERILEYLAVRALQVKSGDGTLKGPILCLVGPPGVGKTSIAHSIAEALGRRYVRMSLGGIRDEAEIRGHRRTYIGAMPGRILQAMRQTGCDNPLFLLDEVDKLGSDYNGDPSSALLEVLDPEQNNNFRDHYVEFPYDLSHVLFITTANVPWDIPQPLLDRMELIEVSGYTEEEKIEIARRHLLPKIMKQHALKTSQFSMTRAAIGRVISWYTAEAGVRQLERELAHVCRRAAVRIAEGEIEKISLGVGDVESLLGKRKFHYEHADRVDQVGAVTGLAWTAAGGDTLSVEVNVAPGKGKMELTGQLGEVMRESALAALTFLRTRTKELKIREDFYECCDVHIHVPEGAVPKDGPSAGITMATAVASALSGRPVRHDIAMTGEITLRGRVLPIGGLKEKSVAARRAGIKHILIPRDNLRDLDDVPASVLKTVKFTAVQTMDEVLKLALLPEAKVKTPASLSTKKEQEQSKAALTEKKESEEHSSNKTADKDQH